MKNIDDLGPLLGALIKAYGESSDRSIQSQEGIIGPSDLGFCRQKAVLMTRGTEQSDSKSIAAAQVGTAIHSYVAKAFAKFGDPSWVIEDHKVTATFPSGATVSGTPDLILPDYNTLIDVKTVDGFTWVKREGTSLNHRYQRHTYTLGAIQEGLLDGSRPVFVGNLYIDRSGKEPEPYLVIEPFDYTLTDEVDSWIADVQYAVMQKEDGSRDIPAPICQKICEYFTVCRGNLPALEGAETIDDEDRLAAIRMYRNGAATEKEGAEMKRTARNLLVGTNGVAAIDDKYVQIRWVHINAVEVAASFREASERLDVRVVKAPA